MPLGVHKEGKYLERLCDIDDAAGEGFDLPSQCDSWSFGAVKSKLARSRFKQACPILEFFFSFFNRL
jgi:hypothetical protein